MERSKNGLKGAGEWSELQKILPDFNKKKDLDLDCDYSWYCKYAADNRAGYVLDTDISHRILEIAKKKNCDNNVEYQCIVMEELAFIPETFDIILNSLAFHYVKDFELLIFNISKWIKKDGEFIFSVEHSVFTSNGNQD